MDTIFIHFLIYFIFHLFIYIRVVFVVLIFHFFSLFFYGFGSYIFFFYSAFYSLFLHIPLLLPSYTPPSTSYSSSVSFLLPSSFQLNPFLFSSLFISILPRFHILDFLPSSTNSSFPPSLFFYFHSYHLSFSTPILPPTYSPP